MLLEQRGTEFAEGAGGRVVQRAEDRFPFLYPEGEDSGAVPVRGLEPFVQPGVVDETGELENVGASDRKAGEVHGGHGALPLGGSLSPGVPQGLPIEEPQQSADDE